MIPESEKEGDVVPEWGGPRPEVAGSSFQLPDSPFRTEARKRPGCTSFPSISQIPEVIIRKNAGTGPE